MLHSEFPNQVIFIPGPGDPFSTQDFLQRIGTPFVKHLVETNVYGYV